LLDEIKQRAFLETSAGYFLGYANRLMSLATVNDRGANFQQIATIIEEHS